MVLRRLRDLLLPELTRFAPAHRPAALRTARAQPLDALELAMVSVGLVLLTALTKLIVPDDLLDSRAAQAALHFAVALPLLAALLLPCHLRRLRRGLRLQLQPPAPP